MKKLKLKFLYWLYQRLYVYIMEKAAYISETIGMCAEEIIYFVPWLGKVNVYTCNVIDLDSIAFDLFHYRVLLQIGEESDNSLTFINQMPKYRRNEESAWLAPLEEVVI